MIDKDIPAFHFNQDILLEPNETDALVAIN
jgi:hypothetical protein